MSYIVYLILQLIKIAIELAKTILINQIFRPFLDCSLSIVVFSAQWKTCLYIKCSLIKQRA